MAKDETKQALMKMVEEEIEALAEWSSSAEGITLAEIEERVLAARQRIGQGLTGGLIEQQEERRNAEIPVNERTGKRLHPKGGKI